MEKLLSIIIPFYRGEDVIETTIKKIIETQKYTRFEIVLVDDGSPNIAPPFWDKIAKIDERIKIVHKVNGGIADARNHGIANSDGDYIAFFDQDDSVEPNMYFDLINKLEETKADMVISNNYIENQGKKQKKCVIKENAVVEGAELKTLYKHKAYGQLMRNLENAIQIPSSVWNCVFRKEIILKHDIKLKAIISYDDDYSFLLKYISYCKKVYLSKDAYYCWKINQTSESHTKKYIANMWDRLIKQYEFKVSCLPYDVPSEEKAEFKDRFIAESVYRYIANEAIVFGKSVSKKTCIQEMKRNFEIVSLRYSKSAYLALYEYRSKKQALIYWLATHSMIRIAIAMCK